MILAAWCLGAYILGSFPTSYLVAKIVMGIDIREHGSGNPGATNVFRVVGPAAGVITFIVDAAKGLVPVALAGHAFGRTNLAPLVVIGLCAILGHMFTIFLRFKGGKGVATATGVFCALLPQPTGYAFAVFAIVLLLTRYVSLSSIAAAVSLPLFAFLLGSPLPLSVFALAVGVIVIYRHRRNIKRLLTGKENRFGRKPEGGDHAA
jgi:glycerol-3-phosphate acyltransferase PlsY